MCCAVDREKLVRFKFRWSEADRDPQDNVLSIDEFKAFRHPEQSKHMLDNMVTDIVASLGLFISVFVRGCSLARVKIHISDLKLH